jgi:hypothetical protein
LKLGGIILKEIIIIAELKNGRKVALEPDLSQMKCYYRYLTEKEIDSNSFDTNGKYVWMEVELQTTVNKGIRYIFCMIDFTFIVLNRFKDL